MALNMSAADNNNCDHCNAYVCVSFHAGDVGYVQPSYGKRKAATTRSSRLAKFFKPEHDVDEEQHEKKCFPAPLVLPGDDLAIDPHHPPQSFRSFLMHKDRNAVTKTRNRLYVVPVPEISPEVTMMETWLKPVVPKGKKYTVLGLPKVTSRPRSEDVCEYLAAFYHGLEVKTLEATFRWVPWETTSKSPGHIGLDIGNDQCVQVRCRPSLDGIARQQLNLSDILDGLLDVLPQDAHAIVLMVDHDLYEDEEDNFCCGRAYGGSRIAVVSNFRYHPCLDAYWDIDYDHMWPASHCSRYVDALCAAAVSGTNLARLSNSVLSNDVPTIFGQALKASVPVLRPASVKDFDDMWFSRIAKTISHEIGHCLGLEHACVMQGTVGLAETYDNHLIYAQCASRSCPLPWRARRQHGPRRRH